MSRVKKKSIGDKLGIVYAVLLFVFIYIPTVIMAVYSFNQQPSNKWWTGFTTEWYGKLFQDAQLWQTFGLSLKISLLSTAIVVVIGTLGAMGMTRYKFFGRNALTYSVYLPMIGGGGQHGSGRQRRGDIFPHHTAVHCPRYFHRCAAELCADAG